jgi:DNA primase large subunit
VPSNSVDSPRFTLHYNPLQVLRSLERIDTDVKLKPVDKRKLVKDAIKREQLTDQADEASHFILRLSYCQSEELRRWFLQQETSLLRYRLSFDSRRMADMVNLQPVTLDANSRLRDALKAVFSFKDLEGPIYTVPFVDALDMVANRQCYVHAGMAYLCHAQLETIVLQQFRTRLSEHLSWLFKHNKMASPDDPEGRRVYPLLKHMHSCVAQAEPSADQSIGGVTPMSLPRLKAHMPLCMRQLQTGLERDHKLKHWGRLQYGLFLKGAGLSLEDALQYFGKMFSVVTHDKFQKDYAYGIRHMYGKEGQRKSTTPYSCVKIIQGNPAPNTGEHHGCPFRHYDKNGLATLLRQLQIGNESDRREIVQLAADQHPQLACLKHYNVMHPNAVETDNLGNHPNAWFRASMRYGESHSFFAPREAGKETPREASKEGDAPSQVVSALL